MKKQENCIHKKPMYERMAGKQDPPELHIGLYIKSRKVWAKNKVSNFPEKKTGTHSSNAQIC